MVKYYIKVGDEYINSRGEVFKVIAMENQICKVLYPKTGYTAGYHKAKVCNGTEKHDIVEERIKFSAADYEVVFNPNPKNELPDLDYGGCKYLGYAGSREGSKDPQYFFKCYCGNTFKTEATNVIKKLNPSCGCSLEKILWKESASLFEKHMDNWESDTDDPLVKKLPVFSGIVGREKILDYSLVDSDVYDVWSKIMWVKNPAGYTIANYSKDNCRRLGIVPPEKRNKLTLLLHRCVLGLGHDTDYKGDHISSNKSDNRKVNLRLATDKENNYNRNKINNKNGLLGVKFKKDSNEYAKDGTLNKRWYAQVMINRKYISKSFHTKEEASWYRDLMAVDLHGEFASLNHPENLEEYKSKLHTLHYK